MFDYPVVFSQKGRSRTGARVHLVSDRGGTACLLRNRVADVSPLDAGPPVDPDEWCASCLRNETAHLALELKLLQGERGGTFAERWDAEAEVAVGEFIRDYLDEHPAPEGTACAEAFERWGGQLRRSGETRRSLLGDDA